MIYKQVQLNDQTVLFLTIQFNATHLVAHSLIVQQLYSTHRQDYQVLLLQVRVDLGVMPLKEYSYFSNLHG